MTDWNRDGHTDAADIATEYAAYNAIMNSKPRRSTPKRGSSTTGSGAGAAWAIIAAAVLAVLTLCSR